jgi:7-carboxy-7-deazaguanine synthase
LSLGQLFGALEKFHLRGRTIMLTGGEPTIQPLEFLVPPLTSIGPVHLETNGTNPLDKGLPYAWITVSPKPPHKVHPITLGRADEIKWLVSSEGDVAALCAFLEEHKSKWMDFKRITVQPVSQGVEATKIAIAACLKYNWRLSLQMHKYLGVE